MLSSDPPDTSSPANVDAAKQVREDIPGSESFVLNASFCLTSILSAYRKKVRRLARRTAEEAFD
jgi:ubiquitin-conjugating enzyme E2 G1